MSSRIVGSKWRRPSRSTSPNRSASSTWRCAGPPDGAFCREDLQTLNRSPRQSRMLRWHCPPANDDNDDPDCEAMAGFLARSDIERLLADPSANARADMATALAKEFEAGKLTPAERRLAEDIFRAL